MAETNFRQALRISDGSLMIFIERPVCAVMLILGLLMLIAPFLIGLITKRRY
jgi:putative tricarboxylic transport membrane protein